MHAAAAAAADDDDDGNCHFRVCFKFCDVCVCVKIRCHFLILSLCLSLLSARLHDIIRTYGCSYFTNRPMLGAEVLAGFLMFATTTGILMALFLDNVGGAWDNAKKYIELGE